MIKSQKSVVQEYERFLRRCLRIEKRLRKVYPEIDPHDLHLIVRNLLLPSKWGKRFLLRKSGKRYVP
ncbi:MAG: hypothetical protein ACK4TF_08745 [Thermodesulfovibrionales bacterium]